MTESATTRPDKEEFPKFVGFMPNDIIHLWDDRGITKVSICRGDSFISLGDDQDHFPSFPSRVSTDQVWLVLDVILKASQILVDVIEMSPTDIRAKVRRT